LSRCPNISIAIFIFNATPPKAFPFRGFERPEKCPVDILAGNFVAVTARTGRQAPGWWLAEGETEEARNPYPFPANISVKKFVSEYNTLFPIPPTYIKNSSL
jgi:hypothetical protein